MAEPRPWQQSQSQPDHDQCIQDFLTWTESPVTYRMGCSGPNNDINRKYISRKILEEKLSRERIDQLLDALFSHWDKPKPDASYIRNHYLRPFAILLCIGEGHMIYHFQRQQSLRDNLLPFRSAPPGFPVSASRRDLYSAFHQEQWAFCALELGYLMDSELGEYDILPINQKDQLDHGGSAITYKILVDGDYDELVPEAAPQDHARSGFSDRCPHTYVIKTYRNREAQAYYEKERDAFLKLKWDGKPHLNIIGFYGSFVREETYNIILEYADLGNLEDFMKRESPPSDSEDRLLFWDRFLDVAKGLVMIHGQNESNVDMPILLGWHQDVRPANILVQSREGAKSLYDCHFKLADLGLSHFKKHVHRNITDIDTFGTTTYGAPETRKIDSNIEQCNLKVKQDVDIWSMGCVFSEVATWVHEGWNKVTEYRRRRSEEFNMRVGERKDCFDNGGDDVLDSVKQIHHQIRQSRRMDDHVTHRVINDLVEEMLLVEDARPAADFMYYKSRRIIKEAYKLFHTSHEMRAESRGTQLKIPPNLPPGFYRADQDLSFRAEVTNRGPIPWTPESPPLKNDQSQDISASSSNEQVLQPPLRTRDTPSGVSMGNTDQIPVTEQQLGPHPSSRQTHYAHQHSSLVDQPQMASPTSYNANESQFHPSQRNIPEYDPRFKNNTSPWAEQSHRRNTGRFASQDSTQSAVKNGVEEPIQVPASGNTSTSTVPQIASPTSNEQHQQREIRTPSLPLNASNVDVHPTPLPVMTVEEGLDLKRTREFARFVQFPHVELFKGLKKRDHAFLIDNAATMGQHRAEVRRVLELLSYMVAPADPDGLDLYFTTEDEKLKPGNHYQMIQALDERPARGVPDMRQQFANILEAYQSKFGKKNFFSRFRDMPPKGPRKLSLYVLTDAIWQPSTDLVMEITTLVHHLFENKLTNKQIGIQFIRFGSDPTGIERLNRLDFGLGLGLDLIDHTAANGNVWKMLLGSINGWFDDD